MPVDFQHQHHPHVEARKKAGPTRTKEQFGAGFNSRLALILTAAVGTMWCAYAFGVLALFALPSAIQQGPYYMIQWISQTFIQLVMLSVIMVGQNILGQAADKRSEMTYKDAEATFHEAEQIQKHLQAQDEALDRMMERLERLEAGLKR
jgi:hypothetical protein